MSRFENGDLEFDIVLVILALVAEAVPEFTPERSRQVELTVRSRYGGLRARIAKRKQHPSTEERKRVIREALGADTATSTDAIARSNGLHRATLYRYVKRGG